MKEYQERYIANIKRVNQLKDVYSQADEGFSVWYEGRLQAKKEMEILKKENIDLLNKDLFPVLDSLYEADAQTLQDLQDFADALMDWKTNLDCGIYVLIHESLLSMYRVRKDRNKIIQELYKLGMGLYYRNRMFQGSQTELAKKIYFENEMVFTEGGSYLKYFDRIDDEETKGYIIRSLANISISTTDRKRRIATTAKVINIVSDPYYREMAPSLPWDAYLRKTYQQMSANRSTLSDGGLSKEELSSIMEACQIIFEPEKENKDPNIRWLWPFYEMEYSCGFTDLKTTLSRMEKLIESTPYDRYDESGLYGNVQLPIYYGRLLQNNPQYTKEKNIRFLKYAYDKMMKALLSFPREKIDDFYFYDIALLVFSYYETEGVDTYHDVISRLIGRIFPQNYIRMKKAGEIASLFAAKIYENDPSHFDDISFIKEIKDPKEKEDVLLNYVKDCGLYYDFGLTSMNMKKITDIRDLFEQESEIFTLHTQFGYDNLGTRESTKRFADIARGHHRWYDQSDGYPKDYIRIESPYRRICDLFAICDHILFEYHGDMDKLTKEMKEKSGTRFSPLALSYLDEELSAKIEKVLTLEKEEYYRELYDLISSIH